MAARPILPTLGVLLVAASGCSSTPEYIEYVPAQLEMSSEFVEYGLTGQGQAITKTVTLTNTGDVQLGISRITLGTKLDATKGHEGSFAVSWSPDDLQVPDNTATGDDEEEEPASEEKTGDLGLDTGVDTGEPEPEPEPDPEAGEFLVVLPPGARLPVTVTFDPQAAGDNYDSLIVETAGESSEDNTTPKQDRVYRDLDTTWRMAYLHGEGEETAPNILVTPRNLDFGFSWPGQVETRYIAVKNVGDGPLTIGAVQVDEENCVDSFEVTRTIEAGAEIDGGMAKVLEVKFTPTNDREAQCRMFITSTDEDSPEVEVRMKANSGTNPSNTAPVVQIHKPTAGYQHSGWGPIQMELTVFDANEPPTNLTCKVRSSLQGYEDGGPAIANCTPPDESGHFFLDVPVEYQEPGLDVLTVQVTDASGVTRRASIPVLINSNYPESDDDGDGFGSTDETWPDCDDANRNTYPLAAEIFDGEDNDCDFLKDEGTDGFDDDQDGMSEAAGDCNDSNPDTYKGAPEVQDNADNDCDGIVDETTSAYDDDNDGFAELDLDCDDTDPTVNPASPEICADGIDNNCNGLKDTQEPCVSVDSEPMIVGRINLTRTAIEEFETTQASVLVHEADGDNLTHFWESRDNEGEIDDPQSPVINWQAPALESGYRDGRVFRLYYIGTDDDDHQVWDFSEVWVFMEGDLDVNILVPVDPAGGCSTVPLAPAGVLGGFATLMAFLRRRRD